LNDVEHINSRTAVFGTGQDAEVHSAGIEGATQLETNPQEHTQVNAM